MSKLWFYSLSLICAISLAISLFLFANPSFLQFNKQSSYSYTLKDFHGKLALYPNNSDTPTEVYEVYTHLLPEQDVLSLQQGIPLKSEAELQRLLEDFGL